MAVRLLAGLMLAGLWFASRAADEAGPPVVAARVAPVGVGLTLEGSLQAVRQATVSAQTSGRVMQLHVRAGDAVRAGQLLVSVDAREAQAGISRSEAEWAQAQAQWVHARSQLERTQQLRAQGFVSQAAVDAAQTQAQAAQAAAQAAQAGRVQSGVARSHAAISAPFDGVVAQTWAEAGDLALPGKPLLSVYAPQAMRAVVQVPSSRQSVARQALSTEVRLPDGRWVRPTLSTALPTTDGLSQTIEWRLDLPPAALKNPANGAAFTPGQPLRVRFVGAQAQALVVPSSAVLRRGELTAVYVQSMALTAGAAHFTLRAVRLGAREGEQGGQSWVEVAAGLSAGERVALDPVAASLWAARPGR